MTNLSTKQIVSFNTNGYLIVKGFCKEVETRQLFKKALKGHLPIEHEIGINGIRHNDSKPAFWDGMNDDVLTYLTHSEKVVNNIATLLQSDSPVCHIYAKFIEKQPNVGCAWTWHQDFAWWYAHQLLFADQVMSMALALTPTNRNTGCSKVLKGSHKIGRLDHGFGDGSKPTGADMIMVNKAVESMELVDIEMEPGDAIFYHSNLLHRCDINLSNKSSWFVVSTYATEDNLSTNDTLAAWHLPIEVIPNDEMLARPEMYFSENKVNENKVNEINRGNKRSQVSLAS